MARPATRPPTRPRRRPRLIAGLAVAAVVAAAVAYFAAPPSVALPPVPDPPTAGADPDLVAAVAAARAAVATAPRSADAWGRYGMVLKTHDFDPDAEVCYRTAALLAPADGRWPYLTARGLVETDPAAAADLFARAAAGELPGPDARAAAEDARAEAQFAAGRPVEPVPPPTTPRRQLLAARMAAAAGDDARAADLLAGLTDHPAAARQALTLLAQVARRLGRGELADQAGRAAAQMPADARWPDPLAAAVDALNTTRVGRLDTAAQLLRADRPAEAERLLRPLAAAGTDPLALFGLARAQAQLGDKAAARETLAALLRIDPRHADGNLQYALSLSEDAERRWEAGDRAAAADQFRTAVAALDRVLATQPNNGKALLLKGITLYKFLGRPADGLAVLERFVQLRPEAGEGHLRLGEAQVAAGRPADARQSLTQAARLAPPGDTRAADALARLKGG